MSKFIPNLRNIPSKPQDVDSSSSRDIPSDIPSDISVEPVFELSSSSNVPVEFSPTESIPESIPIESKVEPSEELSLKEQKKIRRKKQREQRIQEIKQNFARTAATCTGFFQHVTKPRPLTRSYLFWFGIGVGLSSSAIAVGSVWYALEKSLPDSVDGVLTYARPGTLTIKAADGEVLHQVGDVTHDYLKIWEIPDSLTQAFVASEDRRFYDHQGVDFQGILRAAVINVQAGSVKEGGSTITQQLTRISFLSQERKFWRKLREVRLANQIEREFSKEIILERYLNLVYLGAESYGVADAAWVYFGKSVDELTIAESAMIAGLTPAPSLYSPFANPEAAKSRRDLVIKLMEAEGFISAQEAQTAINSPLATTRHRPKRFARIAPHFTDYIRKELPKYVDKDLIEAGGLTVETTLNPEWQAAAQKAIDRTLSSYGRYQRFKQGSLVAVDPRNGQIKAMVGGGDYFDAESKGYFNRAVQAQRQPGSTFKAFVYSTAIAAGFSPYKSYKDAEYIVDGYKPRNFGEQYRNKYVSLRDAIRSSINVVALQALIGVGWEPTIEIARNMGIESKLNPTYSLALGAYEVNLLEITSAYGTLANKGLHLPAYGISRVFDRAGNLIYTPEFEPTRGLDEDSSAIMTWMLQGVVNYGTGRPAQIDRPVAGKTGTSDEARDLWFIGYIPQVVAGVWLGNDDFKKTWGTSGTAATTWRRFMSQIVSDIPVERFPRLPNKLSGREGIIEAKPVRPRSQKFIYRPKKSDSADSSSGSRSNSSRSSRRSSSRSSRSSSSRSSRRSYNRSSNRSSRRRTTTSSSRRSYSKPRRTYSPPRRQAAPAPRRQSAPAPASSASVSKKSKSTPK